MKRFYSIPCLLALALACNAGAVASAHADEKLSELSAKDLSSLVDDLNGFYKQSLDSLFALNKDEDERQLGQRVGAQLLTNYDSRVAGRCTKLISTQTFNQYLAVVHGRMSKSPDDAAKLAAAYNALLAKYGLTTPDLRKTEDCSVFEYDLEPLYESPITVFDPGFWWWQKDRQIRTFIRITIKGQKADGSDAIEATIDAGSPKGHYSGVAKRDLHSTVIQISLMRDGDPLMIDGELSMSGSGYKDPLTSELAPKMPARVLSGFLAVHDGDNHTLNNAVMLLARESDAVIGSALEGFKVPSNASYGSYLNVVLVSFKGKNVGSSAAKFAAIVDDAYKTAQKDNPVQSFHPTRKPLFSVENEIAFLVTDIASDVNALAAKELRSQATTQAARALGAQAVTVVPFYKVKDGKLRVQFPGRPAAELKFNGFEALAKSIFTMYAALGQEQEHLFNKFGIKALSDEIKSFQKETQTTYKAMGPLLDGVLEGQVPNDELDKKIGTGMDQLLVSGQKIVEKLSNILDTRDGAGFANMIVDYVMLQQLILETAAAGAPVEKADAAKVMLKTFNAMAVDLLARANKFADKLHDSEAAIERTLNYMNTFSVHVELQGTYVARGGKLATWTWKWERTLPRELEAFFTGEKYDPKKSNTNGRRGD